MNRQHKNQPVSVQAAKLRETAEQLAEKRQQITEAYFDHAGPDERISDFLQCFGLTLTEEWDHRSQQQKERLVNTLIGTVEWCQAWRLHKDTERYVLTLADSEEWQARCVRSDELLSKLMDKHKKLQQGQKPARKK